MSEVVALAFTEEISVSWDEFVESFVEKGYTLTDENFGLFEHESKETFKASVFETTRYMLFECIPESEGLLPNEVFDYIMAFEDDNALISLGSDTGYGVEVESEMNLKEFKKHFLTAQEEEE